MKNRIAGVGLIFVSVILVATICVSLVVVPDVPIILQSLGASLALFFGLRLFFLARGKQISQNSVREP